MKAGTYERLWSSSLCLAVFHASRSVALVVLLCLSCSDKYCGWRAVLAAAVVSIACCEYVSDDVQLVFDHLLACRGGAQIKKDEPNSNTVGSLNAAQRVAHGLRSPQALQVLGEYERCSPKACRWVHREEVKRFWESDSILMVSFEKYFPGFLCGVQHFWDLFVSAGSVRASIV